MKEDYMPKIPAQRPTTPIQLIQRNDMTYTYKWNLQIIAIAECGIKGFHEAYEESYKYNSYYA